MIKKLLYNSLLYIVLFSCGQLFAFTDQTTTERVINENKLFMQFLNICMSNFADANEEHKEDFFEAYENHFNAEVLFLQSDYRNSFRSIYKSQKVNVELYNNVLNDYYLDESKKILDKLAPSIIQSKNLVARHYLTLGYRDRALARNVQMTGKASRPNLRSHKIYSYIEAIKYSRRSMRYALLALFEGQDIETKKYIYNHLFEIEREENNPFYNRFLEKDEDALVTEIHREFEDYEESYAPKLLSDQKKYEETGEVPNLASGSKPTDTELTETTTAVPVGDERADYLYEKKIERRLRFRIEKRTAQYIRNGDFEQANDLIRKYIDDFSFKLIKASLEVMSAQEGDAKIEFDYDKLYIHHMDNYSRLAKDSILDSFADKVKVVDDIEDPAKSSPASPESKEGVENQQAAEEPAS